MTAGRLLSEAARRVSRHTGIAEETGVVVSVRCRRSGKGRGSVAVGFVFQMFEDSSDDTRLGRIGFIMPPFLQPRNSGSFGVARGCSRTVVLRRLHGLLDSRFVEVATADAPRDEGRGLNGGQDSAAD